jgi:hypothetical protein
VPGRGPNKPAVAKLFRHMSRNHEPEPIRTAILSWVAPRPAYRLYSELLNGLPEPTAFWKEIASRCGALEPKKQEWARWLFFGAVQYLVLGDPTERLASYFPASPAFIDSREAPGAGEVFLEFVHRRNQELWEIVRTREVQINKLGRLALFAPLFLEVARRLPQPLAFIDVGCSVGLGLLWPHFRYVYPRYGQIAPADPEQELRCEVGGTPSLPLNGTLPASAFICGIDTAPLSATDTNDARWLMALTGPNDSVGRGRLKLGLEMLAKRKPRIEQGCVLDVLPRLEKEIPQDTAMLVYHAMTMHHLRNNGKEERFQDVMEAISTKHRLVEAAVKWARNAPKRHTGPTPVHVTLTEWTPEGHKHQLIAETDPAADGAFLQFSS